MLKANIFPRQIEIYLDSTQILIYLDSKGRTVIVGHREDTGTNDGKGDGGGGLVVPLLNIAMPLATVGAVGIAITAVLRDAASHVTVFVLSNLPYS